MFLLNDRLCLRSFYSHNQFHKKHKVGCHVQRGAAKEKGFAAQSAADQAKAAFKKKLDPVLATLEKRGIISTVDGKRKINDVDAYKKAIAAISEVLLESKATCCGKCGRTHVKGTECKKPFLTGKDHCRVR